MQKIKLLLLLLTTSLSAQTVSLTQNTTYGSNCGVVNTINVNIQGDLNLNGHTLTLRNVNMYVLNNLNGGGTVVWCGNSSLCVRGAIQNNPNLNGISCNPLSTQEFDFNKDYGYKFKVYDILGKVILEGITSKNLLKRLPNKTVLIVKVEGFPAVKVYKNM